MRTLICGSLAFDTIMVFPDRFARHILPEQTHMLSVSFQISDMRREWGGCAGNIAYNLRGIGGSPVVMGTLGRDGGSYPERLRELGIATDGVRVIDEAYTAQAFIITDLDDNQITAFHPGAMSRSHDNRVGDVDGIGVGIVAPDGRDGMLRHARELAEHRIPFMFDPGQGLPMFSGEELLAFVAQASYVAVNDYEGKLLEERTGKRLETLAGMVKALVVTRGADGSVIHTGGQRIDIPCVPARAVVDPTGCGDAYRAGLLYGVSTGRDWRTTGQLAALMGSLKIAARGGQNHWRAREEIFAEYRRHFGRDF
jgi:adenosine kinase